jgi:spoIIIJ-associated protein
MPSVEVSGKTIDEAKKAAAAKLGVDVDALSVTVLEQTKGLFGKGGVKIRAEAAEKAAAAAEAPAPAPAPAKEAKAEKAEKVEKAPAKGRRPAKGAKVEEAPAAAAPAAAPEAEEEGGDRDAPMATEADAERLEALVKDLLGKSGLEVSAEVRGIQNRYVNIELDGRDAAFLIGKHGEVLNAMQYLANIIAGRQFANGVRATLDGNNYRRRREEALTKYAEKIAAQVAQRGEEAVLDALPAFERRIVHKALSEQKGITTYSEGEEPNRRVVIAPAE